jgi:hypothetical protein
MNKQNRTALDIARDAITKTPEGKEKDYTVINLLNKYYDENGSGSEFDFDKLLKEEEKN